MQDKNFSESFKQVVSQITDIGKAWHSSDLLINAKYNAPYAKNSLKDLPSLDIAKQQEAIIVSAGPSLHKQGVLKKIKESNYQGTIVAIDGSLVKSLKIRQD